MLVAQRRSDDPYVTEAARSKDVVPRFLRVARRYRLQRAAARYAATRPPHAGFFSDDRSEYGADLARQLPECDVVNLHWVAGLVDYSSFFRAAPVKNPLVWTLHGANPFTGGCHYPGACRRFNDGCGACPELGSTIDNDLSCAIWQRKKAAYSCIPDGRLHLVTPSQWLAGEVRQSVLLGRFPVSVIPHGLDTGVFSPRNRVMAREALDIPRDTRVVLFAAASIGEHRKGFTMLAEALAPLPADAGIHLVSLGQSAPFPSIRLPNLSLGFIDNDRILSLAYSAADLYITPTLDEVWGNTVMESMSCGTPVVGFEVGGVPDMVRSGVSGFVVPKGDIGALRQAVLRVLDDPALRTEMSQNCRRIAVEEYDLKLQAGRYLSLYQSITSN
jgi:glycosyltransferase involved in cell wall biosynthesis